MESENIKQENIDDNDGWFNTWDTSSNSDLIPQKILDEKEIINDIVVKNDIETSMICVDDIIVKNYMEMKTMDILNYQSNVIHYVQILFDQKEGDDVIKTIIEYLTWIFDSSAYLAEKMGQKINPHDGNRNRIMRSFYKFCDKMTQCEAFYGCNNHICENHHYVHSLVNHDLKSLIEFLSNIVEMTEENRNECALTIKTMCFVIRHMAKEINFIDCATNGNSEFYHKNKILTDTLKKNNTPSENNLKYKKYIEKKSSFFHQKNRYSSLNVD